MIFDENLVFYKAPKDCNARFCVGSSNFQRGITFYSVMLFERGLVCDDPQEGLITKPLSNNFYRHYPVVKKMTKVGHFCSEMAMRSACSGERQTARNPESFCMQPCLMTPERLAKAGDLQQLILRRYTRALRMRGWGLGRARVSWKVSPAK